VAGIEQSVPGNTRRFHHALHMQCTSLLWANDSTTRLQFTSTYIPAPARAAQPPSIWRATANAGVYNQRDTLYPAVAFPRYSTTNTVFTSPRTFLHNNSTNMSALTALPNEILDNIISRLPALAQFHLSTTCRLFYFLISALYPQKSRARFRFLLALAQQADPNKHLMLLRVCSKCVQLKPFYHFSLRQASPKQHTNRRCCLACNRHHASRENRLWLFESVLGCCKKCPAIGFFRGPVQCGVHRYDVFKVIALLDERMRRDRGEMVELRELQCGLKRQRSKGLKELKMYLKDIGVVTKGLFPVAKAT
jgi:hypothetical protein